nr:hypothetical protein [Tanacetum cinerariifolium]
GEVNTTSIPTASTQVSPASADVAAASISHDTVCAYITSQSNGSQIKYKDINQIDKDDIEDMDIKGRRENYKQGSKVEESAPKDLMAIDGVGWDWSYMANEEENHALVADDKAPTEFALMAKSSSSLSQVEARLVEFKTQEIKLCEKIRGLEFDVKNKNTKTENHMNELEQVKKEKEDLDSKLTSFESASKDIDTLLGSQRSDKNKKVLRYNVVPPLPAQVCSPPKKDMSWTGLPEFADDTMTDYSRPSLSIESNTSDLQNSNSFVSEHGESSCSILSNHMIKFVKAADSPIDIKTHKVETVRKSSEVRDLIRTRRFLDTMLFPPLPAQVCSPPKKDMSWTGLPEFADDTITDYSRPFLSIESNTSDLQNSNSFVSEHGESSCSILSNPMIKFVKAADSPIDIKTHKVETVRKSFVRYAEINSSISEHGESSESIISKPMIKFVKEVDCAKVKTNKGEAARKPSIKYAEMYRNTSKSPKVRGNQRNWNNLKTQQLGKDFVM